MNDVAKDIIKEEKKLSNIKSEITNLGKNITRNENVVKDKEINLKHLATQNVKLIRDKRELEKKIVKNYCRRFFFLSHIR